MFIYYLFFLILFNHFLTALAGKINTKRENDLRDINYKECPICYDEDIFKLLNRKCDGLATISDYNEMTDDNLLCLCDISEKYSTIENCQKCAGLDMDEFKQKCIKIKKIKNKENLKEMKQDISDIYVADKAITKSNNNINKTTNDEKSIRSKNFKPILLYSLVGGGFIFITATGLFVLRRLMHISGVNNREEVQLDSFRGDLNNLPDINIDRTYNNNSPLMRMDQVLTNNRVSNRHYNNQLSYQGYASASSSEPILNSNPEYIDTKLNNNNKYFSSAPNIPKGILINRGRGNNYVNDTRRSSLGLSSKNSNRVSSSSKTSQSEKKPHVTFSKGLTTMQEFMSKEWNKAINCKDLKKETLVDLGWRNGTVVRNFNPSKEDEIKLRMGDSVIIRLAFDDGWAYAFNRNTGIVGMIPIICVKPMKISKKSNRY
ncbi:hypothetical protein LY90DRAFT_665594 [Neocallimastix californiae]|uniref:SH3 domain-containing protein n=1 Tax=Neocallimastix californiae TaxID=1754190 RepID=A0A1Y2EXZ6_9FUNG|nr:hypothetical protein LY90DRAFT_665594 [Neocallimastix californiae]|eukprot:ORY76450.1 hypothetical protein LY90DRAFT_665594 [Neocallimastix californiae]